jgi:dTMP kinase
MSNEAVHLLFALNRWEMKNTILEMMSNGTNVICDRYAYSGIVYSAAKVSDHQTIKLEGPRLRLVSWARQRPS